MRFERLAQDRFQVLVTSEKLSELDMDVKELWQNSPRAQAFYFDLVQKAHAESHISVAQKVKVEAIGLIPDGVVILFQVTSAAEVKLKKLQKIRKQGMAEFRVKGLVYKFCDFEIMLAACRQLSRTYKGQSSILEWSGSFFLAVKAEDYLEEKRINSILSEYGELDKHTLEYLIEYGTIILHNEALEGLKRFFPNP